MARSSAEIALVISCAVLLATLALLPRMAQAAGELPALGADLDATSVSGLSSGAYMAGQIQVAHSTKVVGAGLVAGGPYACAESPWSRFFPFWPTAVGQNGTQALYQCMQTSLGHPDPVKLVNRTKELAESGAIDPMEGLTDDNVYIFTGDDDQTVTWPVVKAAELYYRKAGVDLSNLTLIEGAGGHAFITEQGGAACGVSVAPFVSDCDYDQAQAILAWIYGPLTAPSEEPQGEFLVFDQRMFAQPGDGFADQGVVYIPQDCRTATGCRIHIALHGCEQSREGVGEVFIRETGFAEVADTNRIVVLFPQVRASAVNLKGCWDWWGYTGVDYLGKDAPQIAAIWAMAERLAKAP
jgi:poly(3-hydroxybutyrate) depolymerase